MENAKYLMMKFQHVDIDVSMHHNKAGIALYG
jgi:hypothetical protein